MSSELRFLVRVVWVLLCWLWPLLGVVLVLVGATVVSIVCLWCLWVGSWLVASKSNSGVLFSFPVVGVERDFGVVFLVSCSVGVSLFCLFCLGSRCCFAFLHLVFFLVVLFCCRAWGLCFLPIFGLGLVSGCLGCPIAARFLAFCGSRLVFCQKRKHSQR